jgi:hypothetical protein
MPATHGNRPLFINWFNAGDDNTEQRLERVNGHFEWVIRPIVTLRVRILRIMRKLLRKFINQQRALSLVDYDAMGFHYYTHVAPDPSMFWPDGTRRHFPNRALGDRGFGEYSMNWNPI